MFFFSGRTTKGVGRVNPPPHPTPTLFIPLDLCHLHNIAYGRYWVD